MFYTIKVFKKRQLLFATDPDTLQRVFDVVEAFKELDKRFPESEGFTIEVCTYPFYFSRSSWQRMLKHIERMDIDTIRLILASK